MLLGETILPYVIHAAKLLSSVYDDVLFRITDVESQPEEPVELFLTWNTKPHDLYFDSYEHEWVRYYTWDETTLRIIRDDAERVVGVRLNRDIDHITPLDLPEYFPLALDEAVQKPRHGGGRDASRYDIPSEDKARRIISIEENWLTSLFL